MQRLLSICRTGAWLATFAVGAFAQAQEPSGLPSAPRTDAYSVYTDAFYNPQSIAGPQDCAPTESGTMIDKLFRGPRHFKIYFSNDVLYWDRTRAPNKVLERTSPNIFDTLTIINRTSPAGDPANLNPLLLSITPRRNEFLEGVRLDAENNGDPLSGLEFGVFPLPPGGLNRPPTINDPNQTAIFDANGNYISPIQETLIPLDVRMQTNDFSWSNRMGFRPTIGIELESGSRIEFTYFFTRDFKARTLIDDVSGAAFAFNRISDDTPPFDNFFQRMGYLSAPFYTLNPFFGGERRRQVGADPSLVPHNPFLEVPAAIPSVGNNAGAAFANTSRDVPREPTVNDPGTTNGLDGPEQNPQASLLWQDGELAIANYSFDLQGAELAYKRPIFRFLQKNWELTLITSVRYFALDEKFSFFFADIAGFDTPPVARTPTDPVVPRSPFDRRLANNNPAIDPFGFVTSRAQPSNETYATVNRGIANDMIGPELGLDAKLPFFYYFDLDLMGKWGFLANFLENHNSVVRGDGLVLYDYRKNITSTSGAFEGKLGVNFHPHPNVTIRGGWEWLWLCNIGTAIGQIDYNLDQERRPSNKDNVLFHGWYGGIEIVF